MSQTYFELGGHNSQLRGQAWWDDSAHAKIIADPSSPLRKRDASGNIELVLGLKPSGASHLLLTSEDVNEIATARRLRLPNPQSANMVHEFESLSPIEFGGLDHLANKLKTLRPKKGGTPSQANRNYKEGNHDLYRGLFELGRLFYRILNKTVNPHRYGVEELSWTQKTRIVSLVFNVKSVDYRTSEDKKLRPDVLDIGFCEARLPAIVPEYATAKHILNGQNKLLGKKQLKKAFAYGASEELSHMELSQRIKELFKDHEGTKSENPIILLVSKEEETLNFLRNNGIEVSGWRSGIRDLLISDDIPPHGSPSREYGKYGNSRETSMPNQHGRRARSRSKSPNRPAGRNDWRPSHARSSPSTSRHRYSSSSSFTPSKRYAPVYVLDVRKLYVKLMQMSVDGVMDMARSQFFKLTDEDGWCAGNEATFIIDIWREMVSSLPIDEQRTYRMVNSNGDPTASTSASDPTPAPESLPYVYDSDDDQDPNDIVVKPQAQIQAEAQKKAMDEDLYALDESDHSSDED